MSNTINHQVDSSSVNNQVIQTIKQINGLLKEGEYNLNGVAKQLVIQAAGMAMLNVVNQQQQLYTIQNAATTVAVKEMLNSSPQEAVQIMNETIKNTKLTESIKELKELMENVSANGNG